MKIVIFCGGYGTRMWPASRKGFPKQFYPLLNGQSFFQNTVARFQKRFDPKDIIVSTEHRYRDLVIKQAPQIPVENIILEPERRDNLGAIGLATAILHARFGNEVLFFSWADHLIKLEDRFLDAVYAAATYAEQTGTPVSVDQQPKFPSVHNGWLKMGDVSGTSMGFTLNEIDSFIEKPTIHTAKRLFKSSKYLLHTGYCAWRADTLLGYYEKYAHETFVLVDRIAQAYGNDEFERILKEEYGKIEKQSIDYGLFEKIPAHERLTIAADLGWQDAGTWQLMYESLATSPDSNLVMGDVETTFLHSEGNLIVGTKGKMIALIGMTDIAVIDTPDGILISKLSETKDVKELFSLLEKENPKFID